MPIDPWIADRFAPIRDIPSFDAARADPQYAERFGRYLQDPAPWTPPPGVTVEDAVADGPHGPVPLKVFRPAHPVSALLWMHGGGFVMGSVDDTESLIPAYELAARGDALVVSVGYRLAVEGVRYPVPLDDVVAGWRWLAQDASRERVLIGGASVGGNLAVATCVRMRERAGRMPDGMLLGYPLLHYPVPPVADDVGRELEHLPALLRFPPEYQAGIVHNYAGRVDDLPADVVPGAFPVAGLPEAWIAPAEYDDLRGSADLFARQLAESGIPVHAHLAEGMVHGFLGRGPSLAPVDAVLDFFAAALRA